MIYIVDEDKKTITLNSEITAKELKKLCKKYKDYMFDVHYPQMSFSPWISPYNDIGNYIESSFTITSTNTGEA